jgi:hypothetical protein
MKITRAALILLAAVQISAGQSSAFSYQAPRQAEFGPEVESFLEYCRAEEHELEFQLAHNEITRREYTRSKNRIAVHRDTVLRIARASKVDEVPELHVVTADEVDALIEDGSRLISTLKPQAVIADRWRFISKVTRGEVFYVFERVAKN